MTCPARKILIFDRDQKVSLSLRDHLPDDFEIETVQSREQALQRLSGSNDTGLVVIVDLEASPADGQNFSANILGHWPEIRCIALVDDPESWDAAQRSGVFRLLAKSCKPDMLALAVMEALHEYDFLTRSAADQGTQKIEVQTGDKALQAFVANISHDLLTPLNHVLGFSSMVEMKMEDNKEEALEYLGHVRSSGERLLKLLKRVLEIVQLTSGAPPDRERTNADITALIARELEDAQAEAQEYGVCLSYQQPPTPIMAYVDEHELRFALQELINNAIKFNSPGGQVSIAARREQDQLMIRISDTGKGLTREALDAALGLFTSNGAVDHSAAPIGLGITFAVFFAHAYGGNFKIESEKDVGAAIILTLPCGAAERIPVSLVRTA